MNLKLLQDDKSKINIDPLTPHERGMIYVQSCLWTRLESLAPLQIPVTHIITVSLPLKSKNSHCFLLPISLQLSPVVFNTRMARDR